MGAHRLIMSLLFTAHASRSVLAPPPRPSARATSDARRTPLASGAPAGGMFIRAPPAKSCRIGYMC